MIDFRYHLISIVAIFLALAAGVTLGAGPLHESLNAQASSESDEASAAKQDLNAELADVQDVQSFQNGFADSVAKKLLADRLADRSVAVFLMPGASSSAADGLQSQIEAAGGSVTGQISLSGKMFDPAERQFAEGIARQAMDGQGVETSGMSSYQLLGTGLARAYLTDSSDNKFDGAAATIASAYREGGFVETKSDPDTRAGLAVFVGGGSEDTVNAGQDELAATVAQASDAASSGTVVAGTPSSADDGGIIGYVRGSDISDSVSTVDAINVRAGQVVTVLALQREADGKSGQYGTGDGADAAMPETS